MESHKIGLLQQTPLLFFDEDRVNKNSQDYNSLFHGSSDPNTNSYLWIHQKNYIGMEIILSKKIGPVDNVCIRKCHN